MTFSKALLQNLSFNSKNFQEYDKVLGGLRKCLQASLSHDDPEANDIFDFFFRTQGGTLDIVLFLDQILLQLQSEKEEVSVSF